MVTDLEGQWLRRIVWVGAADDVAGPLDHAHLHHTQCSGYQ
jgi:hypothetical protein